MSVEHFAIEATESGGAITNLDESARTILNGEAASSAPLNDGDQLTAGATTFAVSVVAETAPLPVTTPPPPGVDPAAFSDFKERLAESLAASESPLYALLDAARNPLVLALLVQSDHQYQTLYEGAKGQQLTAVAPYLVRFPPGSPLLQEVIRHGWGDSWGVFLTSDEPFAQVRKHLRRFLIVKTDEGEQVYFRFYDPRVLRVYLPTCEPQERKQFFGPIKLFLLEDEDPTQLVRFAAAN